MGEVDREQLISLRRRLSRILQENIIPFWYKVVDKEDGGYSLNHDINGKQLGKGTKMIVTQARMVWYFSMLYRTGWAGREALEAASHGYEFLKEKMWDGEQGGFFWEVDAKGNVIRDFKHLYGQAFGLYGVSEYALASGSGEARGFADEIFEVIGRAHDEEYGGYNEFFTRDWRLPSLPSNPLAPGASKTMNTHLHLMESIMTFYELSKSEVAKQRLVEMIAVMSNAVVDFGSGVCLELHDRGWRPIRTEEGFRVSYGHNLEALWLIAEACQLVRIPEKLFLNYFETLYDYCARYGFDVERGGVYESGPMNEPADRLDKVWWVQAESLVAMAYMYKLTSGERYLNDFTKLLEWVEGHQVDWRGGDWFEVVRRDGRPAGMKAHMWKSAYHNGRAMVKTIQIIDSLLKNF